MIDRRRAIKSIAMLIGATGWKGCTSTSTTLEVAEQRIEEFVQRGDLRAATLSVQQNGFEYRRAFGESRSPDEVFLLASITKPMVASGLMLLEDRGELSLSDPVSRYIPEFSEGARSRVIIGHLLSHSSGLPDLLPNNVALRQRLAPLEEFLEGVLKTPLLYEPGTDVQYQSMGFLLASEIAQRITGTPFREFLRSEFFEPMGMTDTYLGLGRFSVSDTAQCQVDHAPTDYGGGIDTREWDWNSPYWRNLGVPWGGAHSTGSDVQTFIRHFLEPDGSVLRSDTARRMLTNQNVGLPTRWGIGFRIESSWFGTECSPETFGHTGSTGTIAWADPERDLSLVFLTTLPAARSRESLILPVSNEVARSFSPL